MIDLVRITSIVDTSIVDEKLSYKIDTKLNYLNDRWQSDGRLKMPTVLKMIEQNNDAVTYLHRISFRFEHGQILGRNEMCVAQTRFTVCCCFQLVGRVVKIANFFRQRISSNNLSILQLFNHGLNQNRFKINFIFGFNHKQVEIFN